jgi:hypothetical protein
MPGLGLSSIRHAHGRGGPARVSRTLREPHAPWSNAEGWRLQHEACVVQHRSLRKAVHELKSQTVILAEILELLRSRTR